MKRMIDEELIQYIENFKPKVSINADGAVSLQDIEILDEMSVNISKIINLETEAPLFPLENNAGKIIKINADADGFEAADMPVGLPAISAGDAGKIVKVNAGETGYELGDETKELPSTTSSDAGKVVKVNDAGTGYELGTAGGGTKLYLHKIACSSYYLVIVNNSSDLINNGTKVNSALKEKPISVFMSEYSSQGKAAFYRNIISFAYDGGLSKTTISYLDYNNSTSQFEKKDADFTYTGVTDTVTEL